MKKFSEKIKNIENLYKDQNFVEQYKNPNNLENWSLFGVGSSILLVLASVATSLFTPIVPLIMLTMASIPVAIKSFMTLKKIDEKNKKREALRVDHHEIVSFLTNELEANLTRVDDNKKLPYIYAYISLIQAYQENLLKINKKILKDRDNLFSPVLSDMPDYWSLLKLETAKMGLKRIVKYYQRRGKIDLKEGSSYFTQNKLKSLTEAEIVKNEYPLDQLTSQQYIKTFMQDYGVTADYLSLQEEAEPITTPSILEPLRDKIKNIKLLDLTSEQKSDLAIIESKQLVELENLYQKTINYTNRQDIEGVISKSMQLIDTKLTSIQAEVEALTLKEASQIITHYKKMGMGNS